MLYIIDNNSVILFEIFLFVTGFKSPYFAFDGSQYFTSGHFALRIIEPIRTQWKAEYILVFPRTKISMLYVFIS